MLTGVADLDGDGDNDFYSDVAFVRRRIVESASPRGNTPGEVSRMRPRPICAEKMLPVLPCQVCPQPTRFGVSRRSVVETHQ